MDDEAEAPKLIVPEKVTTAAAKSAYSSLKSDSKTKVLESPYPNADLVRSGDRFAVLDHERKEITYYMEFKQRDLEGHKAVFQSMVWRNREEPGTRDIPQKVFFEYLLNLHGMITTDNLQTDLGKGFWHNVIIDAAITKRLNVYYCDLNKRGEPLPIRNRVDLDNLVDEIWGKADENRYRLVLISKKPFSIPVGFDIDDFGVPT